MRFSLIKFAVKREKELKKYLHGKEKCKSWNGSQHEAVRPVDEVKDVDKLDSRRHRNEIGRKTIN